MSEDKICVFEDGSCHTKPLLPDSFASYNATEAHSLFPRRDSSCSPRFHSIRRCLAVPVQGMTKRTVSAFPIRITVPWLVPQHSHESRERLHRLPHHFRKKLLLGNLFICKASSIFNAQTLQFVLARPWTVSVFSIGFSIALKLSEMVVQTGQGARHAGFGVDVHGCHWLWICRETHDGKHLRGILREEVLRNNGISADGTGGVFHLGLA